MKAKLTGALAALLLLVLSVAPAAWSQQDTAQPTSITQALKQGEFSLSLRYRFETVDQDGIDKDANASTLRTTVGYRSAAYRGFSIGLVAEDVTVVGNDEQFRNAGAGSLSNGVTDRPVVADPEITELDEAYLAYTGFEKTTLKAGRIALNLDNQRFIGTVGWRQNHQSLDAFLLQSQALDAWSFTYAYVDRVHTITGARQPMSSHLLNIAADTAIGKVGAFAYLLDYDQPARWRFSTSTYGLRLVGKRPVAPIEIAYELELAEQSDRGDNPFDVDAGYRRLELTGSKSGWSVRLGYELLEGDGTAAFQTPLGTNHKFNGFADKFLVTPAAGLEDLYLRIAQKRGSWSWFLDYHQFESDRGGVDYGDELDFQAVYTTAWKQQFALKVASYDADRHATDTTKIMVWTAWGF